MLISRDFAKRLRCVFAAGVLLAPLAELAAAPPQEGIRRVQLVHDYERSFEPHVTGADGRPQENPFHAFTHLGSNYGPMGPQESRLEWREGRVVADLSELPAGEWAGLWHSLAGLADDRAQTLSLRRCFPLVVDSAQPQCVGLRLRASGAGRVRLELQSADGRSVWQQHVTVGSVLAQDFDVPLPADPGDAKLVSWIVAPPSKLAIDALSLLLEFPPMPIQRRAFVVSYAKLARCFDRDRGLVRDRANWGAGQFDCVPATGLFCLATAAAWERGLVRRSDAVEILQAAHQAVTRIDRASGLLPHFVSGTPAAIHPGAEFSAVDTSLYYHSMLLAAELLEQRELRDEIAGQVRELDFGPLRDLEGWVRHGLQEDGKTPLAAKWSDWGGETALVLLLRRMAEGPGAKLRMQGGGRVFEGRGFIAEVQSFYPQFASSRPDAVSGVDWRAARLELYRRQRDYLGRQWPECEARVVGVFGVSAGEGRDGRGYWAHGVDTPRLDLLHPHYMLMAGHWAPEETLQRLLRMERAGLFPPWGLMENVSIDLQSRLPLQAALNGAFESLGAYHLWAAFDEFPNAIHAAALACPMTAEAIQAFYPQ